jgi:hypothetical protein
MLIKSCNPTILRTILQQFLDPFRKVFRARFQQPGDQFVYRADHQTHQEINEHSRDCYVEDCRSKHVIRFGLDKTSKAAASACDSKMLSRRRHKTLRASFMVRGSLVSNKQSVNLSIISAHPVYESQRTRSSRADENKIATRLHNADGAGCLLAQLARERRTPAAMTGERNIRRSDNLFLDRILYLETADHSGKISVGADGYFVFRFVKYFL